MMQEPWFIEERAFAFASLMLTKCTGVYVDKLVKVWRKDGREAWC
jgi:hypothetical protein